MGNTLKKIGDPRLEDESGSRGQESKYVIGISGRIEISGKSLVSYALAEELLWPCARINK